MAASEKFDLWTWENTKEKLLTLPGRLGFPKKRYLQFLDLVVNLKDGSISDTTLKQPFDPKTEYVFFLLYRYADAKDVPITGKLITYKQIPGGRVYSSVFEGRVVKSVEKWLGAQPDLLEKAAQRLRGKALEIGDIAYSIPALPRVPYTYVLWRADEEFPARVKVFLDSSASSYLDAEAHAHLASLTSLRLLATAKAR